MEKNVAKIHSLLSEQHWALFRLPSPSVRLLSTFHVGPLTRGTNPDAVDVHDGPTARDGLRSQVPRLANHLCAHVGNVHHRLAVDVVQASSGLSPWCSEREVASCTSWPFGLCWTFWALL